jgi:hypothetical protein
VESAGFIDDEHEDDEDDDDSDTSPPSKSPREFSRYAVTFVFSTMT